ncbi:MAG: methyltransferase [Alphaproteobacteria bacterium]|nr:methyltransferase [Alphaproteobacteria bacterium]
MRATPILATALLAALLVGCGNEPAADKAAPAAPGNKQAAAPAPAAQPRSLDDIVAGSQRPVDEKARDRFRHPVETLDFFGLKPDMNVVEIWPGQGWYAAIIAPYVAAKGHYTAAIYPEGDGTGYQPKLNKALKDRIAANPELYGDVTYTTLGKDSYDIAPEASADMVLTFRNVHNWMAGGYADKVFAAMFKALKPGGVLGVVEHRGDPELPQDPTAQNGYVNQDYVIKLAEDAGFQVAGHTEVNANPLDTKDHPRGVWTLPPTYKLGDQDHEKYAQIGESDRMTLKFVKPATTGLASAESE